MAGRQQGASTLRVSPLRIVVSTITGITVLSGFASVFVHFTLYDSDTTLRYVWTGRALGKNESLHGRGVKAKDTPINRSQRDRTSTSTTNHFRRCSTLHQLLTRKPQRPNNHYIRNGNTQRQTKCHRLDGAIRIPSRNPPSFDRYRFHRPSAPSPRRKSLVQI